MDKNVAAAGTPIARTVCMIGRQVNARGTVGTVERWEPLSSGMTDTLVRFPDGSLCWFASRELRPVDGTPLPNRQEARQQADAVALHHLTAARAALMSEWLDRWPGTEFGKTLMGESLDGAIREVKDRMARYL